MKKAGKVMAVIIGLCVAAAIVLYISRPYSEAVTISGIERGAHYGALVKSGGVYYELQASDSFVELFAFDEWKPTRKKTYGNPAIMFRFAEEWIVEIYSDGVALAYYGYASGKQKSSAYYTAPVKIIEALSSYVEENGTQKEEPFLESAFHH